MKKKLIAIVTALFMAATLLTACGGDTGVSDETMATLTENWRSLTEFYNENAAWYNEACASGEMERNEAFEALMNQTQELMTQMNNTNPDELTEEKAVEMNNTMMRLQQEMCDALGIELAD